MGRRDERGRLEGTAQGTETHMSESRLSLLHDFEGSDLRHREDRPIEPTSQREEKNT